MATAVGLTASVLGIAAFAQQLTSAIVTIKRFVDDVKDAPEELRDVLDQVENFGKTMMELNVEATRDCEEDADIHGAFTSSLNLCRQAADRVSRLALQLEEDIRKRGLRGGIHAVFKQKTLEAMLRKLDRSKADLHMAHSIYEATCQRRALRKLQQLLEAKSSSAVVGEISSNTIEIVGTVDESQGSSALGPLRRPRKRLGRIRLKLPTWISESVWEAALSTASGRWDLSFAAFRVLDHKADLKVWSLIQEGREVEIMAMLRRRELGLHDQDCDGNTLFQMALMNARLDLARDLASSGADTFFDPDIRRKSIFLYPFLRPLWIINSIASIQTQARYMLEACTMPDETQIHFLATPAPLWTVEQRFQFACMSVSVGPRMNESRWNEILDLIGGDNVDPSLWHLQDRTGLTFLHIIASTWRIIVLHKSENTFRRVSSLFKQAHKAGADFHARCDGYFTVFRCTTPLMILLSYDALWPLLYEPDDAALASWFWSLQQAGIDLDTYIAVEINLWRNTDIPLFAGANGLLALGYDAARNRCQFYWRNHFLDRCGEFWQGIEEPVQSIPGAYVEEEKQELCFEWHSPRFHGTGCLKVGVGIQRKVMRSLQGAVKRSGNRSHNSTLRVVKQGLEELVKLCRGAPKYKRIRILEDKMGPLHGHIDDLLETYSADVRFKRIPREL